MKKIVDAVAGSEQWHYQVVGPCSADSLTCKPELIRRTASNILDMHPGSQVTDKGKCFAVHMLIARRLYQP